MTSIFFRASLALMSTVVAFFVHHYTCLSILLTHLFYLLFVVKAVSYFKCYLLTLLLVIKLAFVQRLGLLKRFQITMRQLVRWVLFDTVATQSVHITSDRGTHHGSIEDIFVEDLPDSLLRLSYVGLGIS